MRPSPLIIVHHRKRRPRDSKYSTWPRGLLLSTQKAVKKGEPGPEELALLMIKLHRDFYSEDTLSELIRVQKFVILVGIKSKTT